MKTKIYLLSALFFIYTNLSAQERYVDEVFTDIAVTSDVIYGENATVLYFPQIGEAFPTPLAMDVYEPQEDTETERPLVLVFHDGNFLPNVLNGSIIGTRRDSSVVEICTQFAKRGYVAASVDYRKGWNPLANSQPERALGLIQAIYRGVQDGRTAVRFFRRSVVEEDNPFGVDIDKITVFGIGRGGGYLTLGMVGLSDYDEILNTTHGPEKFMLDLDGDQVLETPMVVPEFHGDINGENLVVVPDGGGFGFSEGDTTNYVNHVGFSNEIHFGVNISGAIADISWLKDNTIPTISIQSIYDAMTPYEDQLLIPPNIFEPIVRVQGAGLIGAAQQANGANSIWETSIFDDPITLEAIANSTTAGHPYYEGVYPYVQPVNSQGYDEGVVIDWWDENAMPISDGQWETAPWNVFPHPAGGTFHTNGLVLNENMSAEKARGNIANIMDYTLPRACVALDLPCKSNYEFICSTEELLEGIDVNITPNPASDYIHINVSDITFPIRGYQIFDLNGRLLAEQDNLNTTDIIIQRNSILSGMYIAKIQFEEGIVSKKFVFE